MRLLQNQTAGDLCGQHDFQIYGKHFPLDQWTWTLTDSIGKFLTTMTLLKLKLYSISNYIVMLEIKSTLDALITKTEKTSNALRKVFILFNESLRISWNQYDPYYIVHIIWTILPYDMGGSDIRMETVSKLNQVRTRKRSKYCWIARLNVVRRKHFWRIHVDQNIPSVSSCCWTRMARRNGKLIF